MMEEFWGPFALGLFLGIVGQTTALLAYVVVESVGPGKEDKMVHDFFSKPISVVTAGDIRPGDYIHDIADPASLLDIEKRKGHVTSIASKIKSRQIVLRLTGRITFLEVAEHTQAVITREQEEPKLISLKPRRAYV